MKPAIKALLIVALAGILATAALACPLWMSPMEEGMACPEQSSVPAPCPSSVCQVSSPYLDSHLLATPALPPMLPAEPLYLRPVDADRVGRESIRRDAAVKPGLTGQLYLRTHSLLI